MKENGAMYSCSEIYKIQISEVSTIRAFSEMTKSTEILNRNLILEINFHEITTINRSM